MRVDLSVLLFAIIFFVSGCVSSENESIRKWDLTEYTVEKIEIPMPSSLKESHGWMKEFHLFKNVLRFDAMKSEIPLARSALMRPSAESAMEQAGFDPATLQMQWLDAGKLIWLKWKTFPQGQGAYTKQGHLVLQFDGRNWKELFRDSIYANGRAGVLNSSRFDLDIRYNSLKHILELVRSNVNSWSSEEKGFFLDNEFATDEGHTIYYGESKSRTVWNYRIQNRRLKFMSGERFADLPKDYSPSAIASVFDVSVEKLQRLNPKLNGKGQTKGTIQLDDKVGPYRHENDDGLCGDKPCSDTSTR